MSSKPNLNKILVNGCSHTFAVIPDISFRDWEKFCWPTLLSNELECEVVNLAEPGKANLQIIEEALRYLLNYSDVDHVILQLTDWRRSNVYRRSKSFTMIPGDISTQFGSLYQMATHPNYILNSKGNIKQYGDESSVYEILSTFTLLNLLYQYCLQKNIGLSLFNYYPVHVDVLDDTVVKGIPKNIFLQSDITIGISQHLELNHKKEGGHFHKNAHTELCDIISKHILDQKQIFINKDLIKAQEEVIYDYET
jgi:hypothetical protein